MSDDRQLARALAEKSPAEVRVGILGGGQLGRMLAAAAAKLGVGVVILAPGPDDGGDDPARAPAGKVIRARYDDAGALESLAGQVDVVTFEFENPPDAAAEYLARHTLVRPSPRAFRIARDRLYEKRFINGLGIRTAPWTSGDEAGDLARLSGMAIAKTRRMGYDGRGQVRIADIAGTSLPEIAAALGGEPFIIEQHVPLATEISVILARWQDGTYRVFDPVENLHRDGLLRQSVVPARIGRETAEKAVAIARQIADALAYTGVLATEFLVGEDGGLLVNEIAPRVHNSGHWTIEGARTSQFEQHLRAILDWPPGDCSRLGRCVMDNLIGDESLGWREFLGEGSSSLHLYGKGRIRPLRKMGHVTRLEPEAGGALWCGDGGRLPVDRRDTANGCA